MTESARGFRSVPRPDVSSLRAVLPALAICVLGLAGLAAARFMIADTDGRFLVVSGTWNRTAATAMVHAAGGGVIAMGRMMPTVLAISDDPDFSTGLRDRGAWLVLPVPGGLGCTTTQGLSR